jgi:hypothetical protein
VDKVDFLHKLKGLRTFRCAEQIVYRACTKGVQMLRLPNWQRFCTFAPVDMHGFVHSRWSARKRLLERSRLVGREDEQITDGFDQLVEPGWI